MNSNFFLRARLKLTAAYTVIVIIIFAGGFLLNVWLDRVVAEPSVDPLLQAGEGLTIALVAVLSFYFAGRTLRPVEASYKRQKKFVEDAAHELKTPLTVMKTGAEMVLTGVSSNDEYRQLINESVEEIDHMTLTVNDLLFLTENDRSRKITFQKVNLQALVHKQVSLMKPYAAYKKVTLNEDSRECFILGDEATLKRLIGNLLRNAIDYNKPSGSVDVSLSKNKKKATLSIIDTGIGLTENDLAHIFDRFYKVDESRTQHSEGSGLGLSIVQEIVYTHNGQIDVTSQPGKGTTVAVTLSTM